MKELQKQLKVSPNDMQALIRDLQVEASQENQQFSTFSSVMQMNVGSTSLVDRLIAPATTTMIAAAGGTGKTPSSSPDQDTLLSQHQRQAELALQLTPAATLGPDGASKPLLYVLTSTGTKGQYEWQAMGVYDDEDLVEEDLFLLFCPKGPHHVWIGTDFEDMSVLELPTEAFKQWAATVDPGDCEGWVDIPPAGICVQLSGTESDQFWDTYSLGF